MASSGIRYSRACFQLRKSLESSQLAASGIEHEEVKEDYKEDMPSYLE